jgi:DNA-binding transcriptional LysR family regulator
LRLGTVPGLLDTFLIPRLAKVPFLREMNLKLHADSQPAVVAMLERDEIDACMVHAAVDRPGIVSRHVLTEELVVASTRAVDMSRLESYCWIHMGTAQFLRRAARIPSSHQIVVNSMHAIIELVAAGLGIAAVPDYAVAGRRLKIARLPFRGHIHLAYRQHPSWPARVKEAVQALASRE